MAKICEPGRDRRSKTLAGVVGGGVHLIYAPLIASCGAAARAGNGGTLKNAAAMCAQTLQNADTLVQTTSTYLTDPANQQVWIQNYVSFFIDD
jgi:hypothetical protein